MHDVIRAASELQNFCELKGWQYCFIGGLALQVWGEPRLTVDADLTLMAGWGREASFVDALLESFQCRIPDGKSFALENRVLLLRSSQGVGLDVALGALPFEEEAVRRSSLFTFPPDIPLRICSAEDLVVLKAFAGRGQDWVDVAGILARQGGKLDWEYILRNLQPLAELRETPEILTRLNDMRRVIQ